MGVFLFTRSSLHFALGALIGSIDLDDSFNSFNSFDSFDSFDLAEPKREFVFAL